ncbi:MAG TPA: TonB-dependent receptor [Steroidobacteraceae bacterium]|nr:TonB-dependent receptor [Steroidobacteraceae bacterium]
MAKHLSVRQAVRLALLASAAPAVLLSPAAFAQEQDQDASETMDEVVVTGSRIVSPNLQSISPITAIGAEELNLAGKARIEDVLNQLPQAFASQGSNISNASDGTASVDLRGLGSQRTLVLVNGRRLMPGDPDGGSAADLNQIPLTLVKRVDVLTGGASSVYGADAVAGVVNFVMDTEFEGVRIDTNYSFYNHSNDNQRTQDLNEARNFPLPESSVNVGYTRDFSIAVGIGGAEGRGHATFYATYREVDSVLQDQFDFSSCTLNLGVASTDFACGGSGTSDPTHFFIQDPLPPLPPLPNGDPAPPRPATNPTTCPASAGCTFGADGVLRPYTAADQYNFGPVNYFQRPDERYTAGVFANFKLSDKADVYGELMFMDDRSVAQIAPSGAFLGAATFAVNCDNPYWSADMRQRFCGAFGLGPDDFGSLVLGRRNTEGGGRQDDIGHESYRVVTGMRGELSEMLSYDAYFQHGVTKRNSTYLNDFSTRRTALALNAAVDPDDGLTKCLVNTDADPANDDANCVPWNIWQVGGVDPAALAYLQTPGFQRADHRQQIMHIDLTADFTNMVKLPSTETGLVVNFGGEYRDEKTNFTVDEAFRTGDLSGQGGATLPVLGRFDVAELFMEARLPLLEGKTGAQSMSIEAGYRFSDYSTGFSTDTYKAGLDWAPIDSLRFRGSYQHAVRAPNVAELYSTSSVALDGTEDPCAGDPFDADDDNDPTATAAECQLTGLDPSRWGFIPQNPAGQYNGFLGGNPNLVPESSDTVSFGLVFRPNLGDLSIAVDYFDIEIEKTISSTAGGNADTFITNCIATGREDFCNKVHRDANGTLWLSATDAYIIDIPFNLGTLQTSGVDLQASYTLNFGEHRLGFNLVGTKLIELNNAPLPGFDSYDCAGFYGGTCGVPAPEWRHSLRTNWRTPWNGLDVAATWRYYGDAKSERLSPNDQLSGPVNANGIANSVPAYSYLDLTASMTFAEKVTFRVGANNLLDKTPPLIPSGGVVDCPAGPCNGNTWAQVYDSMGRQIFATLTIDF